MEDFVRQTEFVAHSTAVNCLAIGPKSTQVYATGGQDTKVNVFRLGSTENIWTLTQNKSPIECLCFDSDENYVVSGAYTGALRVFDLTVGKLARSLGSHQVAATSLQYHPYGEFLVSGSEDCTMKFWDVRTKACVETYQGHKKGITCVRFSPDGKWVASASKDGFVHFYDLIASKHIDSIKLSPAYATAFEFSPTELTLCLATSSRNLRMWDLETMRALNNTAPEACIPKAIAFSNLGTTLYSAGKNCLKAWDCEQGGLRLADSLDGLPWGESVADLKVSNNDQLVAASFVSNFVTTWEVDLGLYLSQRERDRESKDDDRRERDRERDRDYKAVGVAAAAPPPPFVSPAKNYYAAPPAKSESKAAATESKSDAMDDRASLSEKERLRERERERERAYERERAAAKAIEDDNERERDSAAGASSANAVSAVPQAVKVVRGDDALLGSGELVAMSMGETFFRKFRDLQVDDEQDGERGGRGGGRAAALEEDEEKGNEYDEDFADNDDVVVEDDREDALRVRDEDNQIPLDELEHMLPSASYDAAQAQPAAPRGRDALAREREREPAQPKTRQAPHTAQQAKRVNPLFSPAAAGRVATGNARAAPNAAFFANNGNAGVLEIRGKSSHSRDVDASPSTPSSSARPATTSSSASSVAEIQAQLDRLLGAGAATPSTSSVLAQRIAALKLLRGIWHAGQTGDCIEQLQAQCDAASAQSVAVLVDFFLHVEFKSQNVSLDSCVALLPILDKMLSQTSQASSSSSSGSVEQTVRACFRVFIELTQSFGELIRSTRAAVQIQGNNNNLVLNVDLSREARLNKCNACFDVFFRAKQRVETLRIQCRQNKLVLELLDAYVRLANVLYL